MQYIIGVNNLTRIKLHMLIKKSKLLGILTAALMITLVIGLVVAASTMNPRVTYSGNGNPDNETGREGDLYVEIDTNVLWLFKNDSWEMFAIFPTVVNGTDGPIGPQGPQGEQGPAGATGPAGADGIDGTDGLDGPDGLHGINGIDGTIELGILWWIVVLFAAVTGLAMAVSVYAFRKNSRKLRAS
jgi:hypothetical protein